MKHQSLKYALVLMLMGFCVGVFHGEETNAQQERTTDRTQATQLQRVVPLQNRGVCCLGGELLPLPPRECRERRGRYFDNVQEAERQCRREVPPTTEGVCCLGGELLPLPPRECAKRGGRFFGSVDEAERLCRQERPLVDDRDGQRPRLVPRERTPARPPAVADRFPQRELLRNAVNGLGRYRFRVDYEPGIFCEGVRGVDEKRQYFQLGRTDRGKAVAEVYDDDGTAVGRKLDSDVWFNVRILPLPNSMRDMLEFLETGEIIGIQEEPGNWILDLAVPDNDVLANPYEFFRKFIAARQSPGGRNDMDRFARFAQSMVVRLQMTVSKEDHLIHEFRLTFTYGDGTQSAVITRFEKTQEQIPRAAAIPKTAPTIAMQMLLFEIDTLGGWFDIKTHSPWAQRSLGLIEATDTKRLYAEIYDKSWCSATFTEDDARKAVTPNPKPDPTLHHPIVLGAYHEDETGPMPKYFKSWFAMDPSFKKNPAHYWITQGYYRDYHHYGYQGLGLEDAWYFSFRHLSKGNIGQPAFTLPGDRYYHCRDWGFGYGRIDQKLNRLTWTEAIKQYNSYTWEGKRRAYLMLGFVVHLLQDQAQPDHAFNVAHAGSGMNEEEAYDRYSYCEIMAAEAAAAAAAVCSSTGIGSLVSAFCGGAAFGIAYGACENSIDPAEMGYERLIADKWNAKSVEKVVKAKGVLKRSSYNAYFDELADYSRKVCENLDLESALGCGSLMLVPPIPGADPDIDSNNASETKPYYDLTAALVPEIVSAGAGLIEHFYDIVNYPPIVQRLAIVQWESGDTPRGFADFGKSITECLRYDAEWIASGGKRVLKNNVKPQKLSLDRPGYVFVQFGPADLAPIKGGREMSKARLRLIGNDPLSGDPIDIDVPLTEAHDGALGTYYWGTFDACNCANDPLMLSVRIEATDMAAHLAGRKPSGVDLDGNPATMTFVDHTKYPSYPIQNYEWGPDENHKMWVAPSAWWSEVNPQELVFPRQRGPAEEKVSLTVWEKGYDCQWEEYNGVPCCQAEWRLRDEVVRFGVGQRQVKNTIAGFGFEASLVPGNLPGEAMLTITVVDRRVCLPGKYEFAIDLEVGVSPNVVKKTISLPVKVE